MRQAEEERFRSGVAIDAGSRRRKQRLELDIGPRGRVAALSEHAVGPGEGDEHIARARFDGEATWRRARAFR